MTIMVMARLAGMMTKMIITIMRVELTMSLGVIGRTHVWVGVFMYVYVCVYVRISA